MVRYSDELIDEIRNQNDIVDIISQYVILKRSGRNFFGLCPFHKEKTPSFSVSPDKQIFHCFGCGAGGDVIRFTSKIENVDFKESLEILADRAGIKLPVLDGVNMEKENLKEKVYEINEKVANFYHENLYKPSAKVAQEYVKKRKLDNKTLKNFKIGYAENSNSVYMFLKNQGYTDEQIEASYLARKKNNGYVDTFKNRLMFPIFDVKNRVIAFGGRVLDDSLPKYINSPDTVVYNKGRNLFALNLAKNSEQPNIIMVEGYMDTISLHQRGIDNVVASLGTALTEAQGRLLRKYCEKIVISYDSDGAGQAATLRGLEILKNLGCDVRILQMEGAKDPDEFVIKYGNGRFNMLVQNAISLVEFQAKMLKKDLNMNDINEKIKFLKAIAKLIGGIDSKIEQEIYLDKIAKEHGVSKEAIYAEINKNANKAQSSKILEKSKPVIKKVEKEELPEVINKRENTIISLLMEGQYEAYNQVKDIILPDDFKSKINKKIIKRIYQEFETKKSSINNILDIFSQDEEIVSRLTEIMADDYEMKNNKKAIEGIINIYKKEKLNNKKLKIVNELKNVSDEDAKKNLEKQLNNIIIELMKIK